MLQKVFSVPKQYGFIPLVLIFFIFLIQQSCTKLDVSAVSPSPEDVAVKFFAVPAGTQPAVCRIAGLLKKQNDEKEFITVFARNEGYAVWDKAQIKVIKNTVASFQSGFNQDAEGGDTVIIIPLVLENTNLVNGYLEATVNDSINILEYRRSGYTDYPFGRLQDTGYTAEKYQMQMMLLDQAVFGFTTFKVLDKRLFVSHSSRVVDTSQVNMQVTLTGDDTGGSSYSNGACTSVCISYVCSWCLGNDPDCPNGGSWQNCTVFCDNSAPNPAGGIHPGGGSTPHGGGGTAPVPPQPAPDPCDPIINSLKNDAVFLQKFKSLTFPSVINMDHETGIVVNDRAAQDYSQPVYSPAGIPQIEWTFPLGSKRDAKLHAHYRGTTNVPSMQDLLDLANAYIFNFPRNPNTYFEGITNSYGTPYIIKVNNIARFNEWIIYMQGLSNKAIKKWIEENDRNIAYINNPGKNEREFLEIIKKQLGNSITLYRADNNDCADWSALSLTPDPAGDNGYSVKATECLDLQ